MGNPNNAMTEIALALAMGFFSIMIVAMVSLGAGTGGADDAASAPAATAAASENPSMARVVEARPSTSDGGGPGADSSKSRFVIYHDGRFMDREMNPIDPAAVGRGGAERVVLALPPDMPMQKVLAARRRFNAADPIVAALSEDWMDALRRNER